MNPVAELPSYGVVVVSYASDTELKSFLQSLSSSDCLPHSVVVVENAHNAPLLPTVPEFPITLLHLPHNPGYGGAVNAGVAELPAEVEWILVSNPDVTLMPDTVSTLLQQVALSDSLGSIGPALMNPDGSVYPSARAVPSVSIGIGHALFGALWPSNPWTLRYRGTYGNDRPRVCGWLSGACLIVNREAFDSLGGFDEEFFMFMEDVDLGARLGMEGRSNLYVPAARAVHVVGHATGGAKAAMIRAHHDSAKRFISKRYPGLPWLPLRLIVNSGLAARRWLVQLNARAKPQRD
jgi:N-acetylglucosaminyl-diphospho-decaprenol L-rhamnosyltransferase